LEAATGESFADLGYFRRRPSAFRVGRRKVRIDVSRTGYTGDLGYELWVDAGQAVALWEALWAAGQDHAIRPAGMLALDVVRLEARRRMDRRGPPRSRSGDRRRVAVPGPGAEAGLNLLRPRS